MKKKIKEAPIDYGNRPERMAQDIEAKIQGRETPLSDNPALDIDIDGDGSFNHSLHELKTVNDHNLPIKIAIINNNVIFSIHITPGAHFLAILYFI